MKDKTRKAAVVALVINSMTAYSETANAMTCGGEYGNCAAFWGIANCSQYQGEGPYIGQVTFSYSNNIKNSVVTGYSTQAECFSASCMWIKQQASCYCVNNYYSWIGGSPNPC
jgi:hypothetical protein